MSKIRLFFMVCLLLVYGKETMAQEKPRVASSSITETLYISELFTTHVVFSTEVSYVNVSNGSLIEAHIVEQNKNIISINAYEPFSELCSITVLESNGMIYTFYVEYNQKPKQLIVDMKSEEERMDQEERNSAVSGVESTEKVKTKNMEVSESLRKEVQRKVMAKNASAAGAGGTIAPTFEKVGNQPREIFHVVDRQYGISFVCENILVHNDITYVVLSTSNTSGMSYVTSDPKFVIESKKKSKKSLDYDNELISKSKMGSLNASSEGDGKAIYCFSKITLTKDQVFRIYLYEQGGQRNMVLSLSTKDLNTARKL